MKADEPNSEPVMARNLCRGDRAKIDGHWWDIQGVVTHGVSTKILTTTKVTFRMAADLMLQRAA